ncbi:hypothetical protein [Nitrospira sp. M1]
MKLDSQQAQEHKYYSVFHDDHHPNLEPLAVFLSSHYWIISDLEINVEIAE